MLPVALDPVIHENPVEPDAGVVNLMAQGVGVPFGHWDREVSQLFMDCQLHLNVAAIVGDE